MFIGKLRPLKERGDTIVEVLIAVAVIGMTLGGAYVTTNRNMQTSRNTEERSAGLKVAEGQIEQLKALIAKDAAKVFGGSLPGTFCVNEGDVFGSNNTKCKVNLQGKAVAATPQYEISNTKDGNTFTVHVTWDRVGGGNKSDVRMIYRIHE